MRLARLFVVIGIAALLGGSLLLLGLSLVPLGPAMNLMESQVPDREAEAEALIEESFTQIVSRMRFVGLGLLLTGVVAASMFSKVRRYAEDVVRTWHPFTEAVGAALSAPFTEKDRMHGYALAVIVALAVALRMRFLFQPMRYDEAATFLLYSIRPAPVIFAWYSAPNNHILHSALVRVAYLLLGSDPWMLRLPAFVAGTLLVPAAYLTMRTLFNKHAALLAAGFVAVSPTLIQFSTNARGYTMLILFSTLALGLASYLRLRASAAGWVVLAALTALGLHTIPIMMYPFAAIVVWLLLSLAFEAPQSQRGEILRHLTVSVFLTGALTFILYTPVMLLLGIEALIANDYVEPLTWSSYVESLPSFLEETYQYYHRDTPLVVNVLLWIGLVASLVFHRRVGKTRVPIAPVYVVSIAALMSLQRVIPYARVLLFLLPVYLGLAAAGLTFLLNLLLSTLGRAHSLREALATALAVALALGLGANVLHSRSVLYDPDTGLLRSAEAITLYFRGRLESGDAIRTSFPSEYPLRYYFWQYGMSYSHFPRDTPGYHVPARVFDVVNLNYEEEVTRLDGYSAPEQIDTFEDAELYLLTRISPE